MATRAGSVPLMTMLSGGINPSRVLYRPREPRARRFRAHAAMSRHFVSKRMIDTALRVVATIAAVTMKLFHCRFMMIVPILTY